MRRLWTLPAAGLAALRGVPDDGRPLSNCGTDVSGRDRGREPAWPRREPARGSPGRRPRMAAQRPCGRRARPGALGHSAATRRSRSTPSGGPRRGTTGLSAAQVAPRSRPARARACRRRPPCRPHGNRAGRRPSRSSPERSLLVGASPPQAGRGGVRVSAVPALPADTEPAASTPLAPPDGRRSRRVRPRGPRRPGRPSGRRYAAPACRTTAVPEPQPRSRTRARASKRSPTRRDGTRRRRTRAP